MRTSTKLNLRNVSRKTFWQTVKNMNVILKLKKAKEIHFLYSMPYGGVEESMKYNLSSVAFTKH